MSTAVTVKGQVTLPKAVRDQVGIKPGDRVEVRATAEGNVIVEKAATSVHERLERAVAAIRKRGVVTDLTTDEIMKMTRGE